MNEIHSWEEWACAVLIARFCADHEQAAGLSAAAAEAESAAGCGCGD